MNKQITWIEKWRVEHEELFNDTGTVSNIIYELKRARARDLAALELIGVLIEEHERGLPLTNTIRRALEKLRAAVESKK